MDTYALQRIILKMDLLPGERYVGMVLALHLNQKTETIQVRQKTLIDQPLMVLPFLFMPSDYSGLCRCRIA
jgi:hypothetical protein